jgi:hypothetical protein
VICDLCGQDRVREDTWMLAYFHVGWPPVRFAHACPTCRRELPWARMHRFLFLLSCLAIFAAVAGCGAGIVYLIQWLIRQSST